MLELLPWRFRARPISPAGRQTTHPLPLNPHLLLKVAEKVTEIDVKELPVGGQHDVVVVAVSDTCEFFFVFFFVFFVRIFNFLNNRSRERERERVSCIEERLLSGKLKSDFTVLVSR